MTNSYDFCQLVTKEIIAAWFLNVALLIADFDLSWND